jgi:NADPH:quinone reductase-like Zn-dependent oxidoreductase
MRAIIHTQYGPPRVAQLKEIAKPLPADKELLIKVVASTVNRTDCGFRSAEYFISRFWSGLLKPKYQTLGCEFSGIVEAIGKGVTLFSPGDKIFGYNDVQFGGHADYLVINEDACIAKIPTNLNFIESAPLTEGVHYALGNLRAAKIKHGQTVLINGATGAIGSAAVQLAKYFGAKVTAVCATEHVELIKSLGADIVIDYKKDNFTKQKYRYDLVFDAVGKSTFWKCISLLKKRGVYISTELGPYGQNPFLALLTPIFWRKKLLFPIPTINKADVEFLKELAEKGHFKPVIDRTYPLEQIVDAYVYVESGQKIGNVVIDISN